MILTGVGCQSIEAPDRGRQHQDIPAAHAYPVKGVNQTPIQSISADTTRREHEQRFDGGLSRALEPEDIQSSRNEQNQQQNQQKFVIKKGDDN